MVTPLSLKPPLVPLKCIVLIPSELVLIVWASETTRLILGHVISLYGIGLPNCIEKFILAKINKF